MSDKDTFNEIKELRKRLDSLEEKLLSKYDPKKIYIMFTSVDEDSYMLIGMDRELKSVYDWMSLSNTEEYDNTTFHPSGQDALKSVLDDAECTLKIFDSRTEALLYMTQSI